MAEALAVVGLVSAIVGFLDVGTKVLSRLNDFHSSIGNVPKFCEAIRVELPVLIKTFAQTLKDARDGRIAEDIQASLIDLITDCHVQVGLLDDILSSIMPLPADRRWVRTVKAISSINQEKEIQKINATLHAHIGTLTYYHSAQFSEPKPLARSSTLQSSALEMARLYRASQRALERAESAKEFSAISADEKSRFENAKHLIQFWANVTGASHAGNPHAQPGAINLTQDQFTVVIQILSNVKSLFRARQHKHLKTADGGYFTDSDEPDSNEPSAHHPTRSSKETVYRVAKEEDSILADEVELLCEFVDLLFSASATDLNQERNVLRFKWSSEVVDIPLDPNSNKRAQWILNVQQNPLNMSKIFEDVARKKSLDWLGADLNDVYQAAINSRLPNTCDWILSREVFKEWIEPSSHPIAKVLWVSGPPGFGKTVLCASLVQHLKQAHDQVSYFFSASSTEAGRDPVMILRAWISQLVDTDKTALQIVRKASRNKNLRSASVSELFELLAAIAKQLKNWILVTDGLDECISSEDSAIQRVACTKEFFLKQLKTSIAMSGTKVLLTSRDDNDIRSQLGSWTADEDGTKLLNYRIEEADVRADVNAFSMNIVDEKLPNKDVSVRQHLATKMSNKCEGMFLLVKLQGDELRRGKNAKQLDRIVSNMPAGLTNLYKDYAEKMSKLYQTDKDQAIAILRWVLFAERPLTIGEMPGALIASTNSDLEEFPIDELPDALDEDYVNDEVLLSCGSLIEIQNLESVSFPDRQIRLVHQSTREFLLSPDFSTIMNFTPFSDLDAQHEVLANACLQYLCCSNIGPTDLSLKSSKATSIHQKFLRYASLFWRRHLKKCKKISITSMQLLRKYFQLDTSKLHALDLFNTESNLTKPSDDSVTKLPNGLYYASLYGFHEVCAYLQSQNMDVNLVGGRYGTPLQAAAFLGEINVVIYLLDHGADANIEAGEHVSALLAAVQSGNYQITELLLKNGASITVANKNGYTPLHLAALNGSKLLVELFLNSDPSLFTISAQILEKSLGSAARIGRKDIVELLLERGADPNVSHYGGWTPAIAASANGHFDVVKLLFERGAKWTTVNNEGWSPLGLASAKGHIKIVRLLLDKEADLTCRSNDGWTPLNMASAEGYKDVVELLASKGADIAVSNNDGWTPVLIASANGHKDVTEWLLDRGADISVTNKDGSTPLIVASKNGHRDIVELLLERGADLTSYNKNGWTSLNMASYFGHKDVAELLLSKGADSSAPDTSGWTPLGVASLKGQKDIVEILLNYGAVATVPNNIGWTPLNTASSCGHKDVVELLLDRGADMTTPNNNDSTPLIVASGNGYKDIVELLLDRGADLTIPSKNGLTPLSEASEGGHIDVVELLLLKGANVDVQDKNGLTSLHLATKYGHENVVKVLLNAGANPDRPTNANLTPAFIAREKKHDSIYELLVQHGARKDPLDKHGRPPMTATSQAFCNGCGTGFPDLVRFYHCAKCDNGDYDLCEMCFGLENICREQKHPVTERQKRGTATEDYVAEIQDLKTT